MPGVHLIEFSLSSLDLIVPINSSPHLVIHGLGVLPPLVQDAEEGGDEQVDEGDDAEQDDGVEEVLVSVREPLLYLAADEWLLLEGQADSVGDVLVLNWSLFRKLVKKFKKIDFGEFLTF